MTDRIQGLTVVLDRDYRDDDIQSIVDAIMMVKGVTAVTSSVVEMTDYTARARIAYHLRDKILDLFRDTPDGLRLD